MQSWPNKNQSKRSRPTRPTDQYQEGFVLISFAVLIPLALAVFALSSLLVTQSLRNQLLLEKCRQSASEIVAKKLTKMNDLISLNKEIRALRATRKKLVLAKKTALALGQIALAKSMDPLIQAVDWKLQSIHLRQNFLMTQIAGLRLKLVKLDSLRLLPGSSKFKQLPFDFSLESKPKQIPQVGKLVDTSDSHSPPKIYHLLLKPNDEQVLTWKWQSHVFSPKGKMAWSFQTSCQISIVRRQSQLDFYLRPALSSLK